MSSQEEIIAGMNKLAAGARGGSRGIVGGPKSPRAEGTLRAPPGLGEPTPTQWYQFIAKVDERQTIVEEDSRAGRPVGGPSSAAATMGSGAVGAVAMPGPRPETRMLGASI
eukprot:16442125-Heterocapsa_arctica.AAC.1